MAGFWSVFCGECGCSEAVRMPCSYDFRLFIDPSTCVNHLLISCSDILLLIILVFTMIKKSILKPSQGVTKVQRYSYFQLVSAIANGALGLVHLCFGIWLLMKRLSLTQAVLPLDWWFIEIFHGLTWLLVSLVLSFKSQQLQRAWTRPFSILVFLVSGIFCASSLCYAISRRKLSLKIVSDIQSFLGAILLLLCTYEESKHRDTDRETDESLYAPLNGESNKNDSIRYVTPFAETGFCSKMSFWWLNPLMKKGKEKPLQDEDIPRMGEEDQAESCYFMFLDQLNRQKQKDPSSQPSVLRTIILCHWREIFISGFFAFLKVLALSCGPLLLNSFILVAQGHQSYRYEGFVLAISLFFAKIIESLSQRQWYFRCKLIGVKVRSLLTAAIYKKQLRLSNSSRLIHSGGEIMNYMTVDAYRIGEFPYWSHQTWTTSLQLCFSLVILFRAVGLATIVSLVVILITVLCNTPIAKLEHKLRSKLMVTQDERLKACCEALVNMKVLKLYAWEISFRAAIEKLRNVELKWLSSVQLANAYNNLLFWSSPFLVSATSFGACYFLNVTLHANNVFTFVATLRLVQDPIRVIPDVIGAVIQAKVSFSRIIKFLEAPELERIYDTKKVGPGQKVAICGEVGSGKSTLLAAILREVPNTQGTIEVYGKFAYVSQIAWIQSGTIRENILFGASMDDEKYQETLHRSSLLKDLELFPHGDLTEIGERGINLSGGQKQRIQLARALYQNADIYLLDDPFSAVDAHTATNLFNEYIMEGLAGKTVLLVTHQVEFLPAFDSIVVVIFCLLKLCMVVIISVLKLMSDGEIKEAASYHFMLITSQEFQDLVNAHKETAGSHRLVDVTSSQKHSNSAREIRIAYKEQHYGASKGDQLIKQEEREKGDQGFKPYIQYLNQNKGYIYFSVAALSHLTFVVGQILQNLWMAANVDNPQVSTFELILVYLLIGVISTIFVSMRILATVALGLQSSKSLYLELLNSLFRAPISFYDSTPLGRILSRVSIDLNIVDLDIPFSLIFSVSAAMTCLGNLTVLAVITWQVLFVSIPAIYFVICLQRYYFASAKELMRMNGSTKSILASHLAESVAGAVTIRAFNEEDRFFEKSLDLIDVNASPYFHNFAANEWLIQRLETLSAVVLTSAALCMVVLPPGTFTSGETFAIIAFEKNVTSELVYCKSRFVFSTQANTRIIISTYDVVPGFIGLGLSFGLSLNMSLVFAIQNQCNIANYIISVERLSQYMHIPSEAPEIIEGNRPPTNWPVQGKVELHDLKVRYRPDAPLVLQGITCTFEGGQKIGVVGRTGSGKSTLIGALFRLVEPAGGKIIIDGINICSIGLHDLRSRMGIIPQDPTLFNGTVRYNLDPLSQHSYQEIWEVLGKCQLQEVVQEKEEGLDSSVAEAGSNWSMGQRQLLCLGRALLRRSRILVLDEATASIDNATDLILQKTIRTEFADCTVVTVAHRIPTVMDSTKVLAISDVCGISLMLKNIARMSFFSSIGEKTRNWVYLE
ncbi:hypothetical protein VNO78_19706 [Psophocarpus tetragonolobus]|uniref:ABC-type xenobiotic transporter n=1 Tax=Psophocarpus tetragonolobus TaxID=3891 RepID=A0AAN9S8K4_PSOTE